MRNADIGSTAFDDSGASGAVELNYLRSLFDRAPDAVLVHNGSKVVYANRALCALLRVGDRDCFVGTELRPASGGVKTVESRERVRRLYAGETLSTFEEVLDRYDGTQVEAELSASPFMYLGRPEALVIVCDLTARKTMERGILAQEARFRELFDANPHALAVFDTKTLAFLAVNNTTVARYGYSAEEFARMSLLDIFVSEDIPRLRAQQESTPTTVRFLRGFRHRLKYGEIIDVEISSHALEHQGRPARMVVVFDVTQRLQAQRALEQSEERYRAVFEQAAVGIARVDLNGRFIEVNQKLADILGYTKVRFHRKLQDGEPLLHQGRRGGVVGSHRDADTRRGGRSEVLRRRHRGYRSP